MKKTYIFKAEDAKTGRDDENILDVCGPLYDEATDKPVVKGWVWLSKAELIAKRDHATLEVW